VSSVTPWMRGRVEWVREVPDADLAKVIADVAAGSRFDETGGDVTERSETIRWLSTRGSEGREWGHAGAAAERLGLWSDG